LSPFLPYFKTVHIVPPSLSFFPGHFTLFLSLPCFQATSYCFPVFVTATSENVSQRGKTAPAVSSSTLNKMFILFLFKYFLSGPHSTPSRTPPPQPQIRQATFLILLACIQNKKN
jgi:hypothetical protein